MSSYQLMFVVLLTLKCQIHIWSPPELTAAFNKTPIQYAINNFGRVPFGYSKYNQLLTQMFDVNQTVAGYFSYVRSTDDQPISSLVFQEQQKGAELVIVGDVVDEPPEDRVWAEPMTLMLSYIRVPSLVIGSKEAKIFEEYLKSDKNITLAINFPLINPVSERSQIEMYFEPDDYHSLQMINYFTFSTDYLITYIPKIYRAKGIESTNCIHSLGKFFCAKCSTSGCISQSLYYICIYNDRNQPGILAKKVLENCFDNRERVAGFEQCYSDAFASLYSLRERMSVLGCLVGESNVTSSKFEERLIDHPSMKSGMTPLLYINKNLIRGYVTTDFVRDTICALMTNCENERSRSLRFWAMLSIYGICLLVFGVILWLLGLQFYEKWKRKKMNELLNSIFDRSDYCIGSSTDDVQIIEHQAKPGNVHAYRKIEILL